MYNFIVIATTKLHSNKQNNNKNNNKKTEVLIIGQKCMYIDLFVTTKLHSINNKKNNNKKIELLIIEQKVYVDSYFCSCCC